MPERRLGDRPRRARGQNALVDLSQRPEAGRVLRQCGVELAVLHRDRGLVREPFEHAHLGGSEALRAPVGDAEESDDRPSRSKRDRRLRHGPFLDGDG